MGCEGLGDNLAKYTVALGSQTIVQKRIAGISYLTFSRGDSKDSYQAQNGFLCVTHNPGCSWFLSIGNNGTDKFFDDKHPLPLGCKIDGVLFTPYWPNDICASPEGGFGGRGSYGAKLDGTGGYPVNIKWNNACQSDYGGRILYYKIGFIVSMPANTPMGEDVFDVSDPSESCAPTNYLNYHPSDCQTPPAHCSVPKTASYALTLNQSVSQNSVVYTNQLSINNGCNGKLTSLHNPNLFAVALSANGKTVNLGISGTTTPDDLKTLYGLETPALPVTITVLAPIGQGRPNVQITANYSYYE